MERNHGRFRCSFGEDDEKKVRKYGIPILRVARKPTISIDEIKEWRESRRRRKKGDDLDLLATL
jgi:hypothetical protein